MSKRFDLLVAAAAALAAYGVGAHDFGAGRAFLSGEAQAGEAQKIFHGVGVVTGVDAASGALTVDHGDIPGLMDAMEMTYRVRPAALAEDLKKGDTIAFGVEGETYTIVEIEKVAKP